MIQIVEAIGHFKRETNPLCDATENLRNGTPISKNEAIIRN